MLKAYTSYILQKLYPLLWGWRLPLKIIHPQYNIYNRVLSSAIEQQRATYHPKTFVRASLASRSRPWSSLVKPLSHWQQLLAKSSSNFDCTSDEGKRAAELREGSSVLATSLNSSVVKFKLIHQLMQPRIIVFLFPSLFSASCRTFQSLRFKAFRGVALT